MRFAADIVFEVSEVWNCSEGWNVKNTFSDLCRGERHLILIVVLFVLRWVGEDSTVPGELENHRRLRMLPSVGF